MSLSRIIDHAAHYLPAQAPLEVFVHHNTLHAYQHLPFAQALAASQQRSGASGYLDERQYRAAYRAGRIHDDDLDAALARRFSDELSAPFAGPLRLATLARTHLTHGVRATTAAGLQWELTERHALSRFAPEVSSSAREAILADPSLRGLSPREQERAALQGLWRVCCASQSAPTTPVSAGAALPREAVIAAGGDDPNDRVHPVLITLAGAFLDRGQSHWSMPDRERGFFVAVRRVLGAGHAVRFAWLSTLGQRLRAWEAREASAETAIEALLTELGIAEGERAEFLEHTLLQLPGWAGMFHRLEAAPGPAGRSHARVRLIDFVAVRLCFDVMALRSVGRALGHRGDLSSLRAHCAALPRLAPEAPDGEHTSAWPLFQLAQHAGLSARALGAAGEGSDALRSMLRRLDDRTRLEVWHDAYERHYRDELLAALRANRPLRVSPTAPRFQVVFCLDDRFESLRRHFEERSPAHVTFGAAGFFNVAIAYQGIDDPSTFPLCPVVLTPRHHVEEEPLSGEGPRAALRRERRRRLGRALARFRRASRSLVWGPALAALAGTLAALPLLANVFAPGLAGRLRRRVSSALFPTPKTRLAMPRGDDGALAAGFTLDEKVERLATLLQGLGLTRGFAPVVAVIGHDSSSVNNPHFAAYSCGACGGRSGGPNARLVARMANRPEVRERLRARGIDIPPSTVFVGGVDDTCADRVRFFDVDELPREALPELDALRAALDAACALNAQERCRKLMSAPRDAAPKSAWRHVEARSFDLSQPRPELGHATNAGCVVGRRALTRGLFLDRRVFLASYDPDEDADGSVLERTLLAVGPVCAGINLEYFFSATDNERYGAGTKLPHNVTGLFGVMNGASSDLCTGLPRQMVEIHEPVRLQLVVESSRARLREILDRQPSLAALVENEWVQLCVIEPNGEVWVHARAGGFAPWQRPPVALATVERSAQWFRGREGFVAPARITAGSAP